MNEFGTHYIKSAELGSMYGQQTQFTFDTWEELENNKIDVKLYAEFSAMKSVNIAPNANTSIGWNETNFRTWMSKQQDQKTYLRGAKPMDGDTKAWYNLVIEVPKVSSIPPSAVNIMV